MATAEGSTDSFFLEDLQYYSASTPNETPGETTGFPGDPSSLGSKDPKRFNPGLEKL